MNSRFDPSRKYVIEVPEYSLKHTIVKWARNQGAELHGYYPLHANTNTNTIVIAGNIIVDSSEPLISYCPDKFIRVKLRFATRVIDADFIEPITEELKAAYEKREELNRLINVLESNLKCR
jgi:hypothetical protein